MKAPYWCNRGKSSKGPISSSHLNKSLYLQWRSPSRRGGYWCRVPCWWSCGERERAFQFRKPDSWLPEKALCVYKPIQGSRQGGGVGGKTEWCPPRMDSPQRMEAPRPGVISGMSPEHTWCFNQDWSSVLSTSSKPRCFSAPWSISKGTFTREVPGSRLWAEQEWKDPGHPDSSE